jgi:hypothetical protein
MQAPFSYSEKFLNDFSRIIREAEKKRILISMLTVFGDESHDETEERIFAVAGVVGTKEEWDALIPIWLERTEGKRFHAADCEAGRGDYEGIPHEENLKLYADLVTILIKTNLMGYNRFFPDVVTNIPYHFCFQKVVMWFARVAYLSVPREKVSFTFDMNSQNKASTIVLYEAMAKSSQWKHAEQLMEMVSFASRRESVGIQVADLVAREAMKYCDNFFTGRDSRPVRKSIQALSDSQRYYFDFYNREYFRGWKDQSESLQEKSGITIEDYRQWLFKNKLDDNLFNRHRFLLYLETTRPDVPIFPLDS